jgi:glycosyltransferase involved in cell wall biosynthesis
MRLSLITPHYFPSLRGNSITVQRLESGLRDRGLHVTVCSLDRQDEAAVAGEIERLSPEVLHGFHALKTGRLVLQAARAVGAPAVVTLTGTDVNHDLLDPARRPAVLEVLRAADGLVAFHASIKARVVSAVPEVEERVHVIGQAVRCREAHLDIRGRLGLPPSAFVVFQAAGIRRVKNVSSVIALLAAAQRRHPALRYLIAGPVIEPEEGERVQRLLQGRPWACYLGPLPHEQVCAILSQVQVLINSSVSEGGMSNAVLEAMSRGVPVLASDIEGNRSVIEDGVDGFLYRSPEEFGAKLERLIRDPALAAALGRRGQAKSALGFGVEREIDAHLKLYRSLTAARV